MSGGGFGNLAATMANWGDVAAGAAGSEIGIVQANILAFWTQRVSSNNAKNGLLNNVAKGLEAAVH